MALVTLKEMLADARKNKYAVGAFDVSNFDMAAAVVNVAEELKSPVILMVLKPDLEGSKIDFFPDDLKRLAGQAKIPVCIHLDHATELDLIKKVIARGFSSVMFDGSVLPLKDNIRRTKEVTDYAKKFGVTVEAELGHVGDGLVGSSETGLAGKKIDNPDDYLTSPDEMEMFLKETGVDALAVAIGTAHGVYVQKPVLHFDRLQKLNGISTVPLVMHGGSGTPDEGIKKSIELGICKINIFSEMLTGFFGSLKEVLSRNDNVAIWPSVAYKEPLEEMKKVVRSKMLLFGSNGRA
jgi:ketose-bisphosphate aldolase